MAWVLFAAALTACRGGADGEEPSGAGGAGTGCPAPRRVCGETCTDTSRDPAHCGACGRACADRDVCLAGTCADACPQGFLSCGGGCIDTASDRAHCGACDRACAAGEICSAGVCCPVGQGVCDGACTPLLSDAAHCGACGTRCADDQVCRGGACVDVLPTCRAILQATEGARSGPYTVDPDGPGGAPRFDVFCDMETLGGGLTLVGKEVAGVGETLRYLGVESATPEDLLAGGSGHFGPRFAGKYTEVLIVWADQGHFIRFTPTVELFANELLLSAPVVDFSTSDAGLAGWVAADGGAVFCRAATSPDIRPGDTSWAIKPQGDQATGCGCNSGGWAGRGAFYTGSSDCTFCSCYGPGSFVGVRDDAQPKAGLTTYTTAIYVR